MKNDWQAWYYGDIDTMVGKTFTEVVQTADDTIRFMSDDFHCRLTHIQDCCENVTIESIVGDLKDLENTPILVAEIRTNDDEPHDEFDESHTWTFVEIRTIKGSVTIRYYGSSNGYYSEEPVFQHLRPFV